VQDNWVEAAQEHLEATNGKHRATQLRDMLLDVVTSELRATRPTGQ